MKKVATIYYSDNGYIVKTEEGSQVIQEFTSYATETYLAEGNTVARLLEVIMEKVGFFNSKHNKKRLVVKWEKNE